MLPAWFLIFAIAISLISGCQYAWGAATGKARPNPVSWFFWGLVPLVTFVAQVYQKVGPQALVTLALAVTPLVIVGISIYKYGLIPHLDRLSIVCGALALAGIILWRVTATPDLAIFFSMLADVFASTPTIVKAYRDPKSEYAYPYFLSTIVMVITLLTLTRWNFATAAFPIYILLNNLVIFVFAAITVRPRAQQRAYAAARVASRKNVTMYASRSRKRRPAPGLRRAR